MNPSSQSGFWSPSPWYLAQTVHVLAGAVVMLAAHLHGWDVGLTGGIFLAVAFFKEFLIDISPFEGDTWWGSALDFACYTVGVFGGVLATLHFWWGVGMAAGAIALLFAVDLYRNADWSLPCD